MCSKRLSIFSKVALVAILLLLPVSQLLALPGWLTGEDEQIFQLRKSITGMEVEILQREESIKLLQAQLNEYQSQLENSEAINNELEKEAIELSRQLKQSKLELADYRKLVETLKTELNEVEKNLNDLVITSANSNEDSTLIERIYQLRQEVASLKEALDKSAQTIAKLIAEVENAKILSGLTSSEYKNLEDTLVPLQKAYDEKAAEADQYYQDLVKAKANEDRGLGFMVGVGAELDAGGINLDAKIGIEYNKVMVTVGVEQDLNSVIGLDWTGLVYKTGVQFRF